MDEADKLIAARIRVTLDCPECAAPIAVNGVVDQVLCGACQSVVALEDEFSWRELLTYASHEGCMEHKMLINTKRVKVMDYFLALGNEGGRLFRNHRQILVEVEVGPPACPACKEALGLGALGQEVAKEGTKVDAFCPSCGGSVPIRVPSKRQRHAVHEACVAIACESTVRGDLAEPETHETVLFSCMGCGAPLPINASVPRISTCEFCEATNYLPDALWLRLHPAQRKRPFYFLLRSSPKIHAQAKSRL
jgi:hypothetical protein